MKSWQWIAIFYSALVLTGCASLFQPNQSIDSIVDDQWDCTEVDKNGDWDCEEVEGGVDVENLVVSEDGNVAGQEYTNALSLVGNTQPTGVATSRPRSRSQPTVTALTPPPSRTPASSSDESGDEEEDLPDYLWLAYEPEAEMHIDELPDDFYVVQLASFATKEKAMEYVADQTWLREPRGVRVLAKDKAYFSILLGIYEDKRRAERATKSVESHLDGKSPWIRTMSSLKTAMKAADNKYGEEY